VLALACTSYGADGSGGAAALQLSLSGSSADTVRIEPWGANSLRVRVALDGRPIHEGVGALIKPGSDNKGAAAVRASPIAVDEAAATITNGNIAATVGADGLISVRRASDGAIIMRELSRHTSRIVSLDGNPPHDQTSVMFAAQKTDKVFGMGQHSLGQLDNKNVVQVAYNHATPMQAKIQYWKVKSLMVH
jgi:alpha-D-xyloside xylohydrolase